MAKWNLTIDDLSLGGLAPRYFSESYPSYGNRNMAGAMTSMDLTNPGYITQGPGLTTLTNGDQSGALTTGKIKGMVCQSHIDIYGVAGNLFHKINHNTDPGTVVNSGGTYPHTIDKAAVTSESADSVVVYRGDVYYFYSHSGSAGDIGKFVALPPSFDDDWGSTVPTGAAALSGGGAYPAKAGGNDTFAFGNGRYVGTYDGTTLQTQALDLPSDWEVQDIQWHLDRWWITAANTTNVNSSVFIWDGTTDTWEAEIAFEGYAGASIIKEGVFYQFYVSPEGVNKLAYIEGTTLIDVVGYSSLVYDIPEHYQVCEFKGYILWTSPIATSPIYAYGPGEPGFPSRLFKYADPGLTNAGGMISPHYSISVPTVVRAPLISSTDGSSNHKIAKLLNYDTACSWKSVLYDITGTGKNSKINNVRFNFEKLASGARVNWSLVNNRGETIYSDIISYSKLGAKTTAHYPLNGKVAENFRIELDYSNGSTTAPVSIKNIKIDGTRDD